MADNITPQPTPDEDLPFIDLGDDDPVQPEGVYLDDDEDEDPADRLYEGNDPEPKWWLIRYYRGENFGNEDWLMDQDR